ncbi:hypothetical protein Slin15195_G071090 [Septoria linicola]|uniref:Uncharacterized protein n=1 Tax=Septoria linicola TaxID=215465 RepID=A0A9Q9EK82_9PEZI|nr:hypothetical protein Slin15195_G071090 [Septoria linicola]
MRALVKAAADAGFSPKTIRLGTVPHHLTTLPDITEELQAFMANVQNPEWVMAPFAGKLPNLKAVDLRGGFENQFEEIFYDFGILDEPCDDDYSQALSEYILQGGEICPVPWVDPSDEEMSQSESDDPDGK